LFGIGGMQVAAKQSVDLIAEGKQIFRFDTFGDEDFWADNSGCTRRSKANSSAVLDLG